MTRVHARSERHKSATFWLSRLRKQKDQACGTGVAFWAACSNWSIGGKYAYRLGEASLDRVQQDFFDDSAHLGILRLDRRFRKNWEGMAEVRMLLLPDIRQRRRGALATIYRRLGSNLKVGIGYNFTDFSDDLTDLRYNHKGVFINLIGSK